MSGFLTEDRAPIVGTQPTITVIAVEATDFGDGLVDPYELQTDTYNVIAFDAPIGTPGATETELLTTIVIPVGDNYWDDELIDIVTALPAGTVDVLLQVSTGNYYPYDIASYEQGFGFAVEDGDVTQFGDYLAANCTPVDP